MLAITKPRANTKYFLVPMPLATFPNAENAKAR